MYETSLSAGQNNIKLPPPAAIPGYTIIHAAFVANGYVWEDTNDIIYSSFTGDNCGIRVKINSYITATRQLRVAFIYIRGDMLDAERSNFLEG